MATSTKPPSPYAALIGTGGTLHFAGVDQGIDFTGPGPVYALAPGQITRVESGGTSWPGQGALIVEKLTGGPQSGKSIYYAEDLTPAEGLAVGTVVSQGTQLATATGSGQAPGIEIGFAQDSGIPVAPLPPPRPASQFTPEGASFLSFVTGTTTSEYNPFKVANASNVAATSGTGGVGVAAGTPGASTVASIAGGATNLFDWITNTANLIRVGEIIGGSVLMLVGVIVLTRGVAKQTPVQQTQQATRTVTRTVVRRERAPARRPLAPRGQLARPGPPARVRTSRRVANARYDTGRRPGDRLSEEIPF